MEVNSPPGPKREPDVPVGKVRGGGRAGLIDPCVCNRTGLGSVCVCVCKNMREELALLGVPWRVVCTCLWVCAMPCVCMRVCSRTAWQAACSPPPHRPVSSLVLAHSSSSFLSPLQSLALIWPS